MKEVRKTVSGEIETLAFGGEGIIRDQGLVVFVPFTAPQEIVDVQIVQQKSSYAKGKLAAVQKPSSDRVKAMCPYFTKCGGCQLQHLSYPLQLRSKQQWIFDALTRIGKLSLEGLPEIEPAPKEYGYRRRIKLKIVVQEGQYHFGYIGIEKNKFLSVKCCPIFSSDSSLFEQLQILFKSLAVLPEGKIGELTLIKPEATDTYLLHFDFCLKMPLGFETQLKESMQQYSSWKGAIVIIGGKNKKTYGQTKGKWQCGGLDFVFSPFAFVQNYPEQSQKLYRDLCSQIKALNISRAIDLYCGIGITTLLLAQQNIVVTGVESSFEAVECAKQNQAQNNVQNAKFICDKAERALPQLLKSIHCDLILLNPPRIGLDASVLHSIVQFMPKYVVYISCMPPTLARDLTHLQQKGYRLIFCKAYDLFPQTTHVETLTILASSMVYS